MGEVVSIRNKVGRKMSIAIGLLVLPALVGVAFGAETGNTSAVATAVDTIEYATGAATTLEAGTADNPYAGPAPQGNVASQLVALTSDVSGGRAQIDLVGDGAFQWAAFRLADPARFVLDLTGVVKSTEQVSVDVDHEVLSHVRVGQYRAYPDPVSRVVFDLESPVLPRIESTSEGLSISFEVSPEAAVAVASAAEATSEPPVVEEPVVEEPIVEEPAAEVPVVQAVAQEEAPLPTDYERYSAAAEAAPAPVEPAVETPATREEIDRLLAAAIETAPAVMPPPSAEPQAAEAEYQIAAVEPSPEPVTTAAPGPATPAEPTPEPMPEPVAPMPEPAAPMPEPAAPMIEPAAPMPEPVAPMPEPQSAISAARQQRADSSSFNVSNVQVEEASSSQSESESFAPQSVDAGERRYQGEPMDLSLQDADVKDVLRSFAQLSGLNVVVQPGVTGRVTVELVQVPWDQALEQILKINGLG